MTHALPLAVRMFNWPSIAKASQMLVERIEAA